MLHPYLLYAVATAQREDLLRDAAREQQACTLRRPRPTRSVRRALAAWLRVSADWLDRPRPLLDLNTRVLYVGSAYGILAQPQRVDDARARASKRSAAGGACSPR